MTQRKTRTITAWGVVNRFNGYVNETCRTEVEASARAKYLNQFSITGLAIIVVRLTGKVKAGKRASAS